ncbi:Integrin alpha-PS5 [Chionoecetes opilio]|uniref:Integrin alpha-PS5 n=1 Tax=Chionoecetes opilio TaxID=41210 RepID=A0A8J4Y6S1_CHIOP|nr:Integrin alpha-PS5 [Chionoecetes opilio]
MGLCWRALGLLWTVSLALCFNLEPLMHHAFPYPYQDQQGREAYFGFSVALQHSEEGGGANWVLVGAPRANSSLSGKQDIPEPGAVFSCSLAGDTCEELHVDANSDPKVVKDHGWLGGSLDTQPDFQSNRQATCVCAPLCKFQYKRMTQIYMNGACYIAKDSLSSATFVEELPLENRGNQMKLGKNLKKNYIYGYGQAGFSTHFPDDPTKLVVGAPGVYHWNVFVLTLLETTALQYSLKTRRTCLTREPGKDGRCPLKTRMDVPDPGARKRREVPIEDEEDVPDPGARKRREVPIEDVMDVPDPGARKRREVPIEDKEDVPDPGARKRREVPIEDKEDVPDPGARKRREVPIEDEEDVPDPGARKRREVPKNEMFFFGEPPKTNTLEADGLFGYSITSGKFMPPFAETQYAAGAPNEANSYGKVIIFELTKFEDSFARKQEFRGKQIGEYFGGAVAAADVNGDGLDDLVVGGPMYSRATRLPDTGRIHSFLSLQGVGLDAKRSVEHYGRNVSLARFGTALASPGDLNHDGYEDIVVGAPWEDRGAVYVFLGSPEGLRQSYSQRLAPQDFPYDLRGFGMSLSRGIDIDDNGYSDLAIGSFVSGHALVVKSRPVAKLSGDITPNPSSVTWDEEATVVLKTCLKYEGHRNPRKLSVQVILTLDAGFPTPRALFHDKKNNHSLVENLVISVAKCRDHTVTVKENKIDPDQPITMKLEYKLVDSTDSQFKERPVVDPLADNSTTATVSIVKGCGNKVCRVDMSTKATFMDGPNEVVVIGKRNKLRVEVSNAGEPVYLPTVNVTADPYVTLTHSHDHDCHFKDGWKSSFNCSLSNPIKKDSEPDIVDLVVEVAGSALMDNASHVRLVVNVTGLGQELVPQDNILDLNLRLAAQANLILIGSSEEEQVLYELSEDHQSIVNHKARFNHTYTLVKQGPTSLPEVDLSLDIPLSLEDDAALVKVETWKIKFYQPVTCHLPSGKTVACGPGTSLNSADFVTPHGDSSAHASSETQVGSVSKETHAHGQYVNCSSSLVKCSRLSVRIRDWTNDKESFEVFLELQVDLKNLARHVAVQDGAVFATTATAAFHALKPHRQFIGKKVQVLGVATPLQPRGLEGGDIPWWAILLALLGGLLLLGLLAYLLYKKGFFKREKMEKMKTERAHLEASTRG